jgi:toxin FitB
MILLDSNVISEFMAHFPDERVVRWLDAQPPLSVWSTSINVFEIRSGLQAMPAGKRRSAFETNFEKLLRDLLQGRIVPFDNASAEMAAGLSADHRRRGRPGEVRDTMIAGIVLANHATLATRNIRHFEDIAKSVINPWEA